MSNFSTNLKALRAQKEMSQQELANSMGISKSALNMYERGERQPNFETLELIADYFNVSLDFLLGKTSEIRCPICFQEYDPLNIVQTKGHEEFHNKFLKAGKKFGEIILYTEASQKREDSIVKFRNPSLSFEEKLSAYEEYLRYDFLVNLWKNNLNLNHDDFKTYCKKDIGLASTKEALEELDPKLYESLVEKHGVLDDEEYHKVIQLNEHDNRDIKKDLDSLMEKLSEQEYGPAAFDGEDLSPEAAELFKDELEIALKRLKLINKEKYNPYKNKK